MITENSANISNVQNLDFCFYMYMRKFVLVVKWAGLLTREHTEGRLYKVHAHIIFEKMDIENLRLKTLSKYRALKGGKLEEYSSVLLYSHVVPSHSQKRKTIEGPRPTNHCHNG
jgi:hypothetical protein